MTVMVFLMPAIDAAATRVHEEVADGAEFQAQLLRDGHLHFLRGPLVLLENGDECAALQIGEDQALLLGCHIAFLVLLLFLALAGCGDQEDEQEKFREREVDKEKRNSLASCLLYILKCPISEQIPQMNGFAGSRKMFRLSCLAVD